jgi:hypothetical protein
MGSEANPPKRKYVKRLDELERKQKAKLKSCEKRRKTTESK